MDYTEYADRAAEEARDWTKLDVERLANALAAIYVKRGFFYEDDARSEVRLAEEVAREDAREILDLVADKLDVERLARAVDAVYPNPYSAVMAGQIAGEYELIDEDGRAERRRLPAGVGTGSRDLG